MKRTLAYYYARRFPFAPARSQRRNLIKVRNPFKAREKKRSIYIYIREHRIYDHERFLCFLSPSKASEDKLGRLCGESTVIGKHLSTNTETSLCKRRSLFLLSFPLSSFLSRKTSSILPLLCVSDERRIKRRRSCPILVSSVAARGHEGDSEAAK